LTFLPLTIESAFDLHQSFNRKGFMRTRILGLLLFAAFFGARIYGQGPKPPSKTCVLKAAALFDGKNDTLVTLGLVIVSDGHIVAVGPNATIPAAAEVVDLRDG
jgi:hypothetical protein